MERKTAMTKKYSLTGLKVFAGIEGGATRSETVLIREDGKVLARVDGTATNYLLYGIEKCQETICAMIESAKVKASLGRDDHDWMLHPDFVIDGIGMGLSGCEDKAANELFVIKLLERYPKLARTGYATSDTIGSIYTATPDGGIVLISGTGSNSLLLNPDGEKHRCGGWGHILGDEGASYWIAVKAIKGVIDTEENFHKSPEDTTLAREAIMDHFHITNLFGLMPHFYTRFNKSHFAGLAAKIAALAANGDEFSRGIFYDAGKYLAKHIVGLLPKVDQALIDSDGGLRIVCVGSVWKSWSHLKEGFFAGLAGKLQEMTMVRLKETSAIGCAFLAAKNAGCHLDIDFESNYEVFCHFKCTSKWLNQSLNHELIFKYDISLKN